MGDTTTNPEYKQEQETEIDLDKVVNDDNFLKKLFEHETFRKKAEPFTDKRVTQAIKTREAELTKKFEETYAERFERDVLKRFPAETEEQKKIRALAQENEQLKADSVKEGLVTKGLSFGNAKSLDDLSATLSKKLVYGVKDADELMEVIEEIANAKQRWTKEASEKVLASNTHRTESGDVAIPAMWKSDDELKQWISRNRDKMNRPEVQDQIAKYYESKGRK